MTTTTDLMAALKASLDRAKEARAKVRRCRVCGCTDALACDGGCWWVDSDLCSSCRTPNETGK